MLRLRPLIFEPGLDLLLQVVLRHEHLRVVARELAGECVRAAPPGEEGLRRLEPCDEVLRRPGRCM